MGEPLVLGAEGDVLAGLRVERLDAFEARLEHVDLSGAFVGHLPQPVTLGTRAGQGVEGLPVCVQCGGHGLPAEPVEHLAVLVALPEPPLVGLSVDRDERLADLGEDPDRSAPTADVRPRPSVRPNRPREQQSLADVRAGLLGPGQRRVPLRDPDDALDHGRPAAGADQSRVGAHTEQQTQPRDDHRLARTGLAGDDVEARAQLEDGVVDDPDALDPDLLEHVLSLWRRNTAQRDRPLPRHPATLRSNFATSRSVNGDALSRASRTGTSLRVTSIRAPGRSSTWRRPSHHMIPWPSASGITSTASREVGLTTIGREKSA